MAAPADFESLLRGLHSELVTSGTVQAVTEQFSRLSSDLERVRFVRQMPEAQPLQQVVAEPQTSSAAASDQLRTDGNACFGRGEYAAALRLYTNAAQRAPQPSPQLSLALANRSAALFQLGRYGQCEADAQLALLHGYPPELRYKLHERLGEARRRQGDGVGAERAYCAALAAARPAALDGRRRRQLLTRLDRLICRSAAERIAAVLETGLEPSLNRSEVASVRGAAPETAPTTLAVSPSLPTLSHGQSDVLPAASAAVKVAISEDRGRMLVASRDLSPGDVVIVEPAQCWAALPDAWDTHCYQCCRRLQTAVPCVGCRSVQFCSEQCRAAASAQHAAECGLLERLVELDVGPMALLALRLVVAAGPDRLRQRRLAGGGRPPAATPSDAGYGLVGHTELRSVADLFRRAATAVCLASLLFSQSGPVGGAPAESEDRSQDAQTGRGPEETSALEETAAGLLHYLQSLPCNAHEVSEQVQRGADSELLEVGAAVYPTVSLMNHACDPNVLRVSHGTACVVCVIRPVPAGGELLDNYGFHWAVQGWSHRQQALKRQYFFTCRCQACAEDWATHDQLPDREYVRCDLCDAPPMYCYHEKDPDRVETFTRSRRAYLEAMDGRGSDGVVKDVSSLLSHLTVMDQLINRPSREFNNCQEAVKIHFFAKGNCSQEAVQTDIKRSPLPSSGKTETLNCIERLYGKNKRVTA